MRLAAAKSVPCPRCGAAPGWSCKTNRSGVRPHRERLEVARRDGTYEALARLTSTLDRMATEPMSPVEAKLWSAVACLTAIVREQRELK